MNMGSDMFRNEIGKRVISWILPLLLGGFITATCRAEVITTSAIPVAKGEILTGTRYLYLSASDDPTPADSEFTLSENIFGLAYGATEKITVGVIVPVRSLNLEFNTPLGRASISPSGLGDIEFGARYTAYQWDAPAKTFRLAPYVSTEAPTGDDDNQDPGIGLLPPPLQLGHGAWNPLLGISAIYQTLTWQVEANLDYRFRTEANDFEFGDTLTCLVGYLLNVWPREIGPGGNFFIGGETFFRWDQENTAGGAQIPDSDIKFVIQVFEIQYRARGTKITVFGGFPLWEEKNVAISGAETDYVAGAAVLLSF